MSGPTSERGFGSLHSAMNAAYVESIGEENPYRESLKTEMTKDRILGMLDKALATFDVDPPENDFQRGYMAALEEVAKAINANRYQD
jgi:hypothetical protein